MSQRQLLTIAHTIPRMKRSQQGLWLAAALVASLLVVSLNRRSADAIVQSAPAFIAPDPDLPSPQSEADGRSPGLSDDLKQSLTRERGAGVTQAHVDAINAAMTSFAQEAIARLDRGPPRCLPRICASPYGFRNRTRARQGSKTALASMPGSGNTWVRSVIRAGTRLFTGSIFTDTALFKMGYLGERLRPDSFQTAVVKTHYGFYSYGAPWGWADAGINLIRAPFDAMLAECTRFRGGHTGSVNPATIVHMCRNYTNRRLGRIGSAYTLWGAHKSDELRTRTSVAPQVYLKRPQNVPVVNIFYEDLMRDFARATAYMLAFLRAVNAHDAAWPDVYEGLVCALHERQTGERVRRKAKQPPPTELYRTLADDGPNAVGRAVCAKLQPVWNEHKWGVCDGHFQKQRPDVVVRPRPFEVPENVCE